MRRALRRALQSPGHHFFDAVVSDPPRRTAARLIEKSIDPLCEEALTPDAYGTRSICWLLIQR